MECRTSASDPAGESNNSKLHKVLAKDNDVIIGGSHYADSLGDKDGPAGTYIAMLRHNAHTIAEGLSLDKQTINHEEEEENTMQNYLLFGFILLIMLGSFFFMVAKLNTGA